MISAIALVTQCVHDTPLREWMTQRCAERGIRLTWKVVTTANRGDYKPGFLSEKNVITWGYKMPHWWMTKRGQNVLFLENGLIHQRAGVFVDARGYFADSNLCQQQTWKQTHEVDVEAIAQHSFGWKFGAGGDPAGPMLVTLQMRRDASVRYYFPASGAAEDKVVATLELLREHLPTGRRILIRPHPRERDKFREDLAAASGGVWREDWELDLEGSLSERLPQCCALVTVNSTCASEAAVLGLPVATLGTGTFTGSGITLECADDPARMRDVMGWRPSLKACRAYVQAIRGRHFLPYDAVGAASPEFEEWLGRCANLPAGEKFKYEGIYSNPSLYPRYGHTNHGMAALDLLLQWQPQSVLDVGCGHNEFIKSFRARMPGTLALGVDFACPGADILAEAHALPFPVKRHDVLTSFDMLEHVPPQQVNNTLKEMARVSRRFIFSISHKKCRQTWQGLSLHPTIQPREWWMEQIKTAGGVEITAHAHYITGRWQSEGPA